MVTSNEISGYLIEGYLGVVCGIVVRSPTFFQEWLAGFKKGFGGGSIGNYAQACQEARRQAFNLMLDEAKALGADAVIAMRYDATEFEPGITEVLAYGTAVKLERGVQSTAQK